MIWAKCPKEIFVNKRRVKRAVTEAVCEYNKGTVRTIVETQKALGVATGGSTKQLATILDCRKQKFRKRRQNAKYHTVINTEKKADEYRTIAERLTANSTGTRTRSHTDTKLGVVEGGHTRRGLGVQSTRQKRARTLTLRQNT
ncbi:hypothetical protein TNCV_1751631 [Trichonephila clavipes]|nr:hypothetical protein TNCV_1751631 [Trichonephila clavipes]